MRPLVQAIVQTGKPTVIVFQAGKPISEPWISNTTASLVLQMYPSEQGGNALADILYGTSPSGRLSVSFPRSVGDLPVYYDTYNSGRQTYEDSGYVGADSGLYFGHQYVLGNPHPWFP
jgi:beta-glucosidase